MTAAWRLTATSWQTSSGNSVFSALDPWPKGCLQLPAGEAGKVVHRSKNKKGGGLCLCSALPVTTSPALHTRPLIGPPTRFGPFLGSSLNLEIRFRTLQQTHPPTTAFPPTSPPEPSRFSATSPKTIIKIISRLSEFPCWSREHVHLHTYTLGRVKSRFLSRFGSQPEAIPPHHGSPWASERQ